MINRQKLWRAAFAVVCSASISVVAEAQQKTTEGKGGGTPGINPHSGVEKFDPYTEGTKQSTTNIRGPSGGLSGSSGAALPTTASPFVDGWQTEAPGHDGDPNDPKYPPPKDKPKPR